MTADRRIDAEGRCVIPGFVDSHNHLIFAGDRSAEFAARMAGEKYSAGGIATTVAATFWFLVDTPLGFRLMPEVHAIEAPGDVALSALRVLVDDGLRPDDPDLASPWAEAASSVISIGRRDTTAIVDLRYGHLNVGAEAEALAEGAGREVVVEAADRAIGRVGEPEGPLVRAPADPVRDRQPVEEACADGTRVEPVEGAGAGGHVASDRPGERPSRPVALRVVEPQVRAVVEEWEERRDAEVRGEAREARRVGQQPAERTCL